MPISSILSCLALFLAVSVGVLHYLNGLPSELEGTARKMSENLEQKREAFRQQNQTAFVVGYTGEVGKELVKELARSNVFSKVTLIGRREVQYDDPEIKKFEQKVVDFEKLDEYANSFKADVGFCCLGTTRGKSGAEGFYRVDHDYVVNTGKLAKDGGCRHFSLVSSQGANKKSWFLYPKTKGEVEEEIKAMQFEHVTVFRPGVLMDVERPETRPGEACARAVLRPVSKVFPHAMSTPISIVAKALVNNVVSPLSEAVATLDIKAIYAAAGES